MQLALRIVRLCPTENEENPRSRVMPLSLL